MSEINEDLRVLVEKLNEDLEKTKSELDSELGKIRAKRSELVDATSDLVAELLHDNGIFGDIISESRKKLQVKKRVDQENGFPTLDLGSRLLGNAVERLKSSSSVQELQSRLLVDGISETIETTVQPIRELQLDSTPTQTKSDQTVTEDYQDPLDSVILEPHQKSLENAIKEPQSKPKSSREERMKRLKANLKRDE